MTAFVVLLVLVLALSAESTAQTTPAEPVVVVAGEGVIRATPDRAWVTVAVESRSRNPKDAQAQNANVMTAVQQKLDAAGIPKDAVRTVSYDLRLEVDWVNGRQQPRGYLARNLIEIRLDDITRVGEIIDVAVTSGANAVHNVRFDLKDRALLERQALTLATEDARGRADAAAAGAGRAVDRVIRIEEPGRAFPPPQPIPMMMTREAAADRAETPIVAGEIEIRSSVVLTATLK